MIESGPSSTSTDPGTSDFRVRPSDFNSGSVRAHRRLDGGEGANDAEAELAARQRRLAAADRLHEIGALVLQRLAGLHLRAHDIAVADEQLELAVRVGDGVAH